MLPRHPVPHQQLFEPTLLSPPESPPPRYVDLAYELLEQCEEAQFAFQASLACVRSVQGGLMPVVNTSPWPMRARYAGQPIEVSALRALTVLGLSLGVVARGKRGGRYNQIDRFRLFQWENVDDGGTVIVKFDAVVRGVTITACQVRRMEDGSLTVRGPMARVSGGLAVYISDAGLREQFYQAALRAYRGIVGEDAVEAAA